MSTDIHRFIKLGIEGKITVLVNTRKDLERGGQSAASGGRNVTRRGNNMRIWRLALYEAEQLQKIKEDSEKERGESTDDTCDEHKLICRSDKELDKLIKHYMKDEAYYQSQANDNRIEAVVNMIETWGLDFRNVVCIFRTTAQEFDHIVST